MANTYIDTNAISRRASPQAGEFAEILNNQLAGAKNVVATLRWLKDGDRLDVGAANAHHLLYLMEGEASIQLGTREHRVGKGGGLYVGPSEAARLTHSGRGVLKLFHLVVPRL